MNVIMTMEEYLELKTKADRVDKAEHESTYWQGNYNETNNQRLEAQDRFVTMCMWLKDEYDLNISDIHDIIDDYKQERSKKRKAKNVGDAK